MFSSSTGSGVLPGCSCGVWSSDVGSGVICWFDSSGASVLADAAMATPAIAAPAMARPAIASPARFFLLKLICSPWCPLGWAGALCSDRHERSKTDSSVVGVIHRDNGPFHVATGSSYCARRRSGGITASTRPSTGHRQQSTSATPGTSCSSQILVIVRPPFLALSALRRIVRQGVSHASLLRRSGA